MVATVGQLAELVQGRVVGDDVENDVLGAIRAGLAGVLLDRGADRPADLPHVANLTALVQSRLNGG